MCGEAAETTRPPSGPHPRPRNPRTAGQADPNNTEYQNELAIGLGKLGDLRERAATTSPPGAYTRSVQIAERLARADPDNTDYQSNLAVSLSRVADVRRGRGNHQAALRPTPAPWKSPNGWPPPSPTTPTTKASWQSACDRLVICGWRAGTPSAPWGLHPRCADPRTAGPRRPRQHRIPERPGTLPLQGRRCAADRGNHQAALAGPHPLPGNPRAAGAHRPQQHRIPKQAVDRPRQAGRCAGGARRPRVRPGAYTRALQIPERLARADPDNTAYQNNLALFLSKAADVRRDRGDRQGRPPGPHPRPRNPRTTGPPPTPTTPTTKTSWQSASTSLVI